MIDDAAAELLRQVQTEFRRRLMTEQLPRITRCIELLGEGRVWQRPSPNTNSVGNLVLHLAGNTTQWILAEFTELADARNRDAEFEAQGGTDPTELQATLKRVYTAACCAVDGTEVEDLLSKRVVQGYDETGLSVILHVLEHTSGHAGQIYAWTKQATGIDLKFYDL